MKIYAKFCNNYDAADTLYKQKIKKKEFEAFLNVSKMLNVIYGTMHAVIAYSRVVVVCDVFIL